MSTRPFELEDSPELLCIAYVAQSLLSQPVTTQAWPTFVKRVAPYLPQLLDKVPYDHPHRDAAVRLVQGFVTGLLLDHQTSVRRGSPLDHILEYLPSLVHAARDELAIFGPLLRDLTAPDRDTPPEIAQSLRSSRENAIQDYLTNSISRADFLDRWDGIRAREEKAIVRPLERRISGLESASTNPPPTTRPNRAGKSTKRRDAAANLDADLDRYSRDAPDMEMDGPY
ncbi:unnamed protein product [Peniophora sp. CBMAI 1063]|nr:unnamed protein product [Peniophora sp. CBMAI 1063]